MIRENCEQTIANVMKFNNLKVLRIDDIDGSNPPILIEDTYNSENTYTLSKIKYYDGNFLFEGANAHDMILSRISDINTDNLYGITCFIVDHMEDIAELPETKKVRYTVDQIVPKNNFLVLDVKQLVLLSDIFHEYKDCNRGVTAKILNAMSLERLFEAQTHGVYCPDTTYDVKSSEMKKKVYYHVAYYNNYADCKELSEKGHKAALEAYLAKEGSFITTDNHEFIDDVEEDDQTKIFDGWAVRIYHCGEITDEMIQQEAENPDGSDCYAYIDIFKELTPQQLKDYEDARAEYQN